MKKQYEELLMEIIDIYDDVIMASAEDDPFNDGFVDQNET